MPTVIYLKALFYIFYCVHLAFYLLFIIYNSLSDYTAFLANSSNNETEIFLNKSDISSGYIGIFTVAIGVNTVLCPCWVVGGDEGRSL